MSRVQKNILLRVSSAYKMQSDLAFQIIIGIVFVDLLGMERIP